MRTLSDTLLAAQKLDTPGAIWKLTLTYGIETGIYYYNTRITDIKHNEQPYSQTAEVLLDNSDALFEGGLTSFDFRGWKAILSYGCTTGAGDEYSDCAPLWVEGQHLLSYSGKLVCHLNMIGLPDLLDKDKASAPYSQLAADTNTVQALINAITGATLAPYTHCTAHTPVYDSVDALMHPTTGYMPKESFAIAAGESRMSAIRRLVRLTGCMFRVQNDGSNNAAIHIFVPTIALTRDLQIAASADDCDEDGTGDTTISYVYVYTRSYINTGVASYRCSGFRFPSVTIPPGATITSAYMSLYRTALLNPARDMNAVIYG